ncbi:predicted protein [Thalassiosira pseudonana CCMP1335]|uniref:Integrase catalytic domain-containing protein n=1 Tax=Thalassiosira pseudonana TaxID=35128 RepID=B8C8X1_THAPS|nr:predicted protein [Thalassiosira pseudonana CCMP1335]EED89749.1 predicted protein [Thalassiosira pseudonana CCMP1335]
MITTATKHALQCGDYTEAWKEWNRGTDAQKTWRDWKSHWTRAFNENRAIQRLTGNSFRANATIETELSDQLVTSLDNLAYAAVQKNDTIEKFIETIKQQQDTIHKLQAQNGELMMKLLGGQSAADTGDKKGGTTGGTHAWDPSGYCWTHGYKVKKGHNSKTCKTRGEGHQETVNVVKANIPLLCSSTIFSGCANPPNLNTTALLDTAANISLLANGAPSERANSQLTPKSVMQPKGDRLFTTETLLLLLNKVPLEAREAHRAPGITNNLLSASALADAGCELFFHQTGCEVSLNGEIILRGWRDPDTRLWRVSLLADGSNSIVPAEQDIVQSPTVNGIYECENTGDLIQFYYATMGYPVLSTWTKAIDKGYFRGWRGLTSDRVRRFIKPNEQCEQGHMDQRRTGIRSTKSSHAVPPPDIVDTMEEPTQAPQNDKTNMVFMTIAEAEGQLFTDQTGRFPVTSNRGNNYIVLFYVVDANFIKSYPIKSRHRTELLKAYDDVYKYLCIRGYRPKLHRLDNETSKDVEDFIAEQNAKHQYTPPDIHRTNIAERMIRTWKNHMCAVRAGTPKTYRLSNWCKDLEQVDMTLNMMRPCTQNPNLSAYEAMEGMFSFDATPMAPIGTECMIHVKPSKRHTWGYHSMKAWYFAPALKHYRCIKVVTDAGAVRTTDTFKFLHHTLPVPKVSSTNRIVKATKHLRQAIDDSTTTAPDELQAIENLRALLLGSPQPPPLPETVVQPALFKLAPQHANHLTGRALMPSLSTMMN